MDVLGRSQNGFLLSPVASSLQSVPDLSESVHAGLLQRQRHQQLQGRRQQLPPLLLEKLHMQLGMRPSTKGAS